MLGQKSFSSLGGVFFMLGVSSLWVVKGWLGGPTVVFFPFELSSLSFDFVGVGDYFSVFFFGVLMVICSSVFFFVGPYMGKDPFLRRFFFLMVFFMLSMVVLIFVPHFFFLILGWDGLGFTSFLLISYYKCESSFVSSMKTFLIKRLGDGFLVLGVSLLLLTGSLKFFHGITAGVLGGLVMLCFMTKSALFPFSSWLPAAMAAPTPVSALVHSSTLVTAGIYLMFRMNLLWGNGGGFFFVVTGLVTLLIASFSAMFEFESKKMVAFSTLSQLGFMAISLGVGSGAESFFHLMKHAGFKALLFMCVGYMMNESLHNQDLRKISFGWVGFVFFSSLLSLSGLKMFSGFYSKESILEFYSEEENPFFFFFFWGSMILTWVYSMRLGWFFFSSKSSLTSIFSISQVFSVFPLFLFSVWMGKVKSVVFGFNSLHEAWGFKVYLLLCFLGGLVVKKGGGILGGEILFLMYYNSSFWKKSFFKVGSGLFGLLDKGWLKKFFFRSGGVWWEGFFFSLKFYFFTVLGGVYLLVGSVL